MPLSSMLDPEAAILTAILDEICQDARIEAGSHERDEATALLMSLYWAGYRTVDDLKRAFAARLEPDIKRQA